MDYSKTLAYLVSRAYIICYLFSFTIQINTFPLKNNWKICHKKFFWIQWYFTSEFFFILFTIKWPIIGNMRMYYILNLKKIVLWRFTCSCYSSLILFALIQCHRFGIYKSQNGKSGNGIMGMRRVSVGMQGIVVGMRVIWVIMRRIGVGMRRIWVGLK